MLTALNYGPGNKGKDLVNYSGIIKTPFIKELSLNFKARSGYVNSNNEELIITEEATKEEKEEKEEIDEPRLNSGSPA